MYLGAYNCVFCNLLIEEANHHLFLDCSFVRVCWDIINIDVLINCSFLEMTSQLKVQLNSQFFMEAIILLCWTIWTARNDLIFKGIKMNMLDSRRVFFKELRLLKYGVKSRQADQFSSWIQSGIGSYLFLIFFVYFFVS